MKRRTTRTDQPAVSAYIHKSGQLQSIYYESQDTLSKRIVELNKTIKPIPEDVIEWANEYALHHPAVRRKSNVTVCAMCGNAMVYSGSERNVKCMECGRYVRIIESEMWKAIKGNIRGWFSTLGVIDGIQLQRTFEIRCRYYLDGRNHQYYVRELSRHWLSPQGKLVITALPRMMGQFLDCFPLVGKIELLGTSQMVYDYIADNSELYPDCNSFLLSSN